VSNVVLVVEDDVTMQKMALKVLRSRGFQCELAPNGREALRLASSIRPALILMDLSLPEMNGWEATKALKADPTTAAIPVVAITAHAMVGDRETALAAGCSECLTKPYEISELVELVVRYLSGEPGNRPVTIP
jgi:CheY-like chemotaxis protein